MIKAIGLLKLTACILFLILTDPSFSQEIVLSMHENYTLENCILQVEDIDSQAEEVWISIPMSSGQSSSMVLGMNETLTCGNATLMVKKFYAGDSYDIVCLKLLTGSISG